MNWDTPAAMLTHIIQRIAENGDCVEMAVRDSLTVIPRLFLESVLRQELPGLIQTAIPPEQ